jgi:predicted transglutaminase-like cysteine proteinase
VLEAGFRDRAVALRGIALALLAATVLGVVGAPGFAAQVYPPIFASRESASADLTHFPKWRGMLERVAHDRRMAEGCKEDLLSRCPLQRWSRFLASLDSRDRLSQLRAVNREINRHRYVLDSRNWGVTDHWSTPLEFFRKDGDCEDFAIAKFMSLRALGVPNRDMRIVVLQDLERDLPHAVLVVYAEGTAYVLDNQFKDVVPADQIQHYRPIYSINEEGWWRHLPDQLLGADLSS